jgi:hypothetical protein
VQRDAYFDLTAPQFAMRLLVCAAIVAAWRFANRREEFTPVFEHFGVHFLLLSMAALVTDEKYRIIPGSVLLIAFSIAVIAWGDRDRRELFVLYGFFYILFAVDVLVFHFIRDETLAPLLIVLSIVGAIAGLFAIHSRFRELRA